jgi:hypothetical protein
VLQSPYAVTGALLTVAAIAFFISFLLIEEEKAAEFLTSVTLSGSETAFLLGSAKTLFERGARAEPWEVLEETNERSVYRATDRPITYSVELNDAGSWRLVELPGYLREESRWHEGRTENVSTRVVLDEGSTGVSTRVVDDD